MVTATRWKSKRRKEIMKTGEMMWTGLMVSVI